ncbi:Undecaprenyl-phosphate mannosyltransferase [Rubripirellula tenax]|uniref:Undecaprenyl-phosphate mannosyltransferase n=1 Tax=Rubripirellula tenax TaxID=2528015 RepID=A0A5C6FEU9_9BACT|nr:polyprenol monophosphomannose synthase [Rubripirellula tenax]TWU60336.1 Undecaprenyl-phosphate mannosyltransferase [Rubripirellula tenax]
MRLPFPDLSIIVPTYQEAGNLAELFRRIEASVTAAELNTEVLVVDDHSQDGTVELCEKFVSSVPLKLIVRTDERGLSSAVMRGFREARGDILLVMDADLSHPPERIPAIIAALNSQKDSQPPVEMVIGSRYIEGGSTTEDWGWIRWLNSKIATLAARPFTSAKDPMAGFFALHRLSYELAADRLDPIGYKIGLELIVKCQFRNVQEIPIQFCNRTVGESKLNLRQQLLYLTHIKRLLAFRIWGDTADHGDADLATPMIAGRIEETPIVSASLQEGRHAEIRKKAA